MGLVYKTKVLTSPMRQSYSNINKSRFCLMAMLYGFSFLVLSLGVAVCVIKSPSVIAQDYLALVEVYEDQIGATLPDLPQAELTHHLQRQEKLILAARALDPKNPDISQKLVDLEDLKSRLRVSSVNIDATKLASQ